MALSQDLQSVGPEEPVKKRKDPRKCKTEQALATSRPRQDQGHERQPPYKILRSANLCMSTGFRRSGSRACGENIHLIARDEEEGLREDAKWQVDRSSSELATNKTACMSKGRIPSPAAVGTDARCACLVVHPLARSVPRRHTYLPHEIDRQKMHRVIVTVIRARQVV